MSQKSKVGSWNYHSISIMLHPHQVRIGSHHLLACYTSNTDSHHGESLTVQWQWVTYSTVTVSHWLSKRSYFREKEVLTVKSVEVIVLLLNNNMYLLHKIYSNPYLIHFFWKAKTWLSLFSTGRDHLYTHIVEGSIPSCLLISQMEQSKRPNLHCLKWTLWRVWIKSECRWTNEKTAISLLIGRSGRFLTLGHMGRDKYQPD